MMLNSKDKSVLHDSKTAPPPGDLPLYGNDKAEFVSYVAWSNYEAALEQKRFLFGIRRRDLRRGTLAIGRPGMGKTKFLQVMFRQDMAHDYGCTLFDFRGEISRAIIDDIPESRAKDVLIFDPTHPELRTVINPLRSVSASFRQPLLRIIKQVMQDMFPERWNPQLEYLVHNTFALVLESKEPTMRLAYDILTDESVRTSQAQACSDQSLHSFFIEDYPRWQNDHEAEALLPLINIMRLIIMQPELEEVYDTTRNSIDLSQVFTKKNIVIIHIDPDRLGDAASTFLGTILLARYLEYGQQRDQRDILSLRKDHPVYFDEFPHLESSLFHTILSSGPRLGIPSVVAMNSTLSADSETVQRLLARTDNLFCFRLFSEDASRLRSEMLPVFDTRDLQNLPPRNMYCRIVINGDLSVPFSAETLEVHEAPNTANIDDLFARLNEQYGLPEPGMY